MKVVATDYHGTPEWIPEYTDDYVIYDRNEEPLQMENTIRVRNFGDADYDKLTWIVENYYDLPDVFLLTKTNLFKFITPEEWNEVKNNTQFTPLLTKNHKETWYDEDGQRKRFSFYENGIYKEFNNSWFMGQLDHKYFRTYEEFAKAFGLPNPQYLSFAPGGSYIVTKDRIHRWPQSFYDDLRSILPYSQRPGEAHMIERTYYNLWS